MVAERQRSSSDIFPAFDAEQDQQTALRLDATRRDKRDESSVSPVADAWQRRRDENENESEENGKRTRRRKLISKTNNNKHRCEEEEEEGERKR